MLPPTRKRNSRFLLPFLSGDAKKPNALRAFLPDPRKNTSGKSFPSRPSKKHEWEKFSFPTLEKTRVFRVFLPDPQENQGFPSFPSRPSRKPGFSEFSFPTLEFSSPTLVLEDVWPAQRELSETRLKKAHYPRAGARAYDIRKKHCPIVQNRRVFNTRVPRTAEISLPSRGSYRGSGRREKGNKKKPKTRWVGEENSWENLI